MPPDNPHKLHFTQNFSYRDITPLTSGSLEERQLCSVWFSLWITNVHIKIQWVPSEKLLSLVELLEPAELQHSWELLCLHHIGKVAPKDHHLPWMGTGSKEWGVRGDMGKLGTMHMYPLAPSSSQGSFSGWAVILAHLSSCSEGNCSSHWELRAPFHCCETCPGDQTQVQTHSAQFYWAILRQWSQHSVLSPREHCTWCPLHCLCPPHLLTHREQALCRGCDHTAHRALITIKAAMWICQCYITQIRSCDF